MKIWVLVNLQDKTVGHGTTAGVAELGSKSAYGFDPLPAFKTREAAEAYIAGDAFMEIFLKPVELEVLYEADTEPFSCHSALGPGG